MVAITGSCGKTMTKELISLILNTKYKVIKNDGNKNNHIGVPLTLTRLNNNYDILVIEIGMNHKGEIAKLSSIVKPDISVITNIGTAHIGNLGSQKNIYKAKMEITKGMTNGIIIANGQDKYLQKINDKKYKVIKTKNISYMNNDLNKTIFCISDDKKKYKFVLNIPGKHLISNCMLAIELGKIFQISYEEMQKVIKKYKSLGNRLNIIKLKNNTIIDDSYNSNYEAVLGLIDIMDNISKNKVLILGDILELGKYSKKIHRKIGKIISNKHFDKIYYIGKYMYYAYKESKNSIWFKSVEDFLKQNVCFENSIIAVKGSRGMHLEKIIVQIKS